MRRTFLLVALLMGAFQADAVPVKSMLAARNAGASESAEGWKNPYITDGLIAMWDGEWNAGGGKHEESPARWVACVGNYAGYRMKTNDNSLYDSIDFGEDYAAFNFNNRFAITDDRMREVLLSGNYTIEVRGTIVASQNNSTMILSFLGKNSSYLMNAIPNRRYKGHSIGTDNRDVDIGGLSKATFTVTAESGLCSIVVNGITRKTGLTPFPIPVERPNEFGWISAGDGVANYWNLGTKTTINSFRVYNRQLTDEEIAHNYNVDKERFGI